ncbi:aspartate kinase [Candidatus Roizmanbacteria bacterium]|jgi:aspartokinase|nr:aspartate kinase [Candidatus Roizmanbacteria bacterium]
MITVSETVESIVRHSGLFEEAILEDIINYSALARKIRPEVEKQLYKNIQEGAILMALKRLSSKIKHRYAVKNVFKDPPDMIVRSNLIEFTTTNSDFLVQRHKDILAEVDLQKKYFLIITQGVFETTVIVSQDLGNKISRILKKGNIISQFDHLSAITIKLPRQVVSTPGVYNLFLKTLHWEGINVIEVASTYTEFTIILKDNDVDRAFSVLINIFK